MNILYELWLHCICGFEPEKVEKAVVLFENDKNKFSSVESELKRLKKVGLEGSLAKRISSPELLEQAHEINDYCKENQIRIINQESEEYPQFLKNTNTPPRILFAKGERMNFSDKLMVSVVGCRKATPQGLGIARRIGRNLAQNGIVVVSGMAEGIDAEAHRGAIEAGGKTIAVLAGSVDAIYPRCNEKLYYEILKNGTILSERPPGTVVKRYFYQQRNRIVVGLSHGTVVVEGKEPSGTSMTARLALENNRDVFAVPGSPMAWQASLPNKLLAEGAMVVDKVERPAEYYREIRPEFFRGNEKIKHEQKIANGLSAEDEVILKYIEDNGGIADSEELAENCGIAPNVLGSRLTLLCIRGVLRQQSGNRYMLV